MPLNSKLLRKLFASGAVITLLVVAGFYFYSSYRIKRQIKRIERKVSSEVSQSIKGFTFSKSSPDGHTLFTIHAARAEQFKEGQKAELHDVEIVIYGQRSDRFDRIYGSDFQWDPQSGDIVANGDVDIDLESDATNRASRPNQSTPAELKNPIHLKTSGLIFNRNTGLAKTREKIEFHTYQANGSAVGATYDSHANLLTLQSAVRLVTTDKHNVTLTAQSALITKEPRKAVLHSARIEQPSRTIQADNVTVLLRDDNNIDRIQAAGNVQAQQTGQKPFNVNAPQAEFLMGERNQARSGTLSGGVSFSQPGASPAQGKAGRILVTFGPNNQLLKAHAEEAVQLAQGLPGKTTQIQSEGLDLFVENGKRPGRAVTSGAAQVLVTQGNLKHVITAGQFQSTFNAQNHPSSVTGNSNARIVTSTPGQPDRISTSRDLTADFNSQGAISLLEQSGEFHLQEGTRSATAERARYILADDTVTLIGSPRLMDTGVSLTANNIQLNRKTNVAAAEGAVKTTYVDLKAQPGGAMLGSSDPIHVTGESMTASRSTEVAKFTKARLWQGLNIVEGPVISFDRLRRSLEAQGSPGNQVSSVFVQPNKNGKTTPVNVTADRLSYVDAERKAVFNGHVLIRGADATTSADSVQVLLSPRGNQSASQLDRIIAQGDIVIQQQGRKATGNLLVYTAQDEKFVLTASEGRSPSIFDAEQGQITGDSLTFFTHDDRVLVGSKESSHTLIQTRIRDAGKK
ncbi:MAG TPA: LPS export ABC transporter periplasmic protein LptC [Candidatus Angelobacter sp.]|jgi:lipopolysaccharide export system protein LptA|nr:LPS export ABC transporter periplasmic protein LptC [Candidatus Angelobacter sp.]